MVWSEAVPPHNSNTVPPHKPGRFLPVNACWKLNTIFFANLPVKDFQLIPIHLMLVWDEPHL